MATFTSSITRACVCWTISPSSASTLLTTVELSRLDLARAAVAALREQVEFVEEFAKKDESSIRANLAVRESTSFPRKNLSFPGGTAVKDRDPRTQLRPGRVEAWAESNQPNFAVLTSRLRELILHRHEGVPSSIGEVEIRCPLPKRRPRFNPDGRWSDNLTKI